MAFVSDTVRILTDSELEQAEYTEGEEIVVQDSSDILSDTVNYFPSPARTEPLVSLDSHHLVRYAACNHPTVIVGSLSQFRESL